MERGRGQYLYQWMSLYSDKTLSRESISQKNRQSFLQTIDRSLLTLGLDDGEESSQPFADANDSSLRWQALTRH